MRKFFTLFSAAMLTAAAASAQTLNFEVNGENVANNAVITTISHDADVYEDGDYAEVTLTVHPEVIVSPSADGLYQMSAEITKDTSKGQLWTAMWCGFGNGYPFKGGLGSCAAFNIKKDNPFNPGVDEETYNLLEGDPYDCGLHVELFSEDISVAKEASEIEIVMKGWPVSNPANVTSVTLICKYEPEESGVKGIEADNISINGNVIYAEGETVEVYTTNGALVMSAANSADLNNLAAGLYIYRAGKAAGKVAVK